MAVYTVHEPPMRDESALMHAERFVFVRDGFSFWAFLFGPLWMLKHRLWLALLAYVAAGGVLMAAMMLAGMPPAPRYLVIELLSVLIGLEAASLRRGKLARQGWHNLGVVVADDIEGAERRFFDTWVARAPAPLPPLAAADFPLPPATADLLPESGARA